MGYLGSDKHKIGLFDKVAELFRIKQDKLVEGDNITLTPLQDGTVEISASGGGEGTVTDVLVDGQSVVNQDGEAEITMPTDFTGATAQQAGSHGLVPAPAVSDADKFLKGDGTWGEAGGGNVDDVQMNGQSIVTNKVASFQNYVELTQAEYDALPASKLTDGILYCIKDTGIVEGEKFAPVIYSLEEREIGVWTDGKPLYQKTIHLTDLTKNAYISIYLTELDVDTMAYFGGQYLREWPNGSSWELYNMHDTISTQQISIISQLRWESDTNRLLYYNAAVDTDVLPEAWITLQYTKTTDTPGSGKWGTDGVPKFLSGSVDPTSSLGSDGETYIKTDGTAIEMVYYKINGTWLPEFTDGDLVGY